MSYSPAQERRLKRVHRLESEQPERFCWATLATLSSNDADLHTAEREVDECREDARHCGNCWCGKWESDEGGDARLSKRERP